MHTLSSASRTCMASASAVECTATVAMPSSLHARRTRRAISPRLAIRILSNMLSLWRIANSAVSVRNYSLFAIRNSRSTRHSLFALSLNNHQRLAELHRLAVLDKDLLHGAGARRRNLVHGLHRFDDQ